MLEEENFFKSKYFYILAAIVLLLFIRLPFMGPDTAFSAQAEKYSEKIEAPLEAAGSEFFYIGTAKFFNGLLKYPLYAQYALNTVILLMTIIAFFELLLLLGSNNHEAFLFTLLFSFIPVNLASSFTGGNYLVLGLAASTGLYNSIKTVIFKDDQNAVYLGGFVGILSGLSNLVFIFLLPLFIYTTIKVKKLRIKLYAAAALVLTIAVWMVPALITGDFERFSAGLTDTCMFTLSPLIIGVNFGVQLLFTGYLLLSLLPLLIYSVICKFYHIPREYLVLYLLVLVPASIICAFLSSFTLLLCTFTAVPFFLIVSASFKVDTYNKYVYLLLLVIVLLFQFFGLRPLPQKSQAGPAYVFNLIFFQYTNLGIQTGVEALPSGLLDTTRDL